MSRWVVLVVRPTPSGVAPRSLATLAEAVRGLVADPVRVAHLDHGEPSVPAVLDDATGAGIDRVLLVPLAVPADPYLTQWLARTVAHWRESRSAPVSDVMVADGLAEAPGIAATVAELAAEDGEPVTASPAAFRSPAWSRLPPPGPHLLVCRGPRCTAYGAGATHRAATAAARDTNVLVTSTGCFGPCNLGPLVVEHPGGIWHDGVTPERAAAIAHRAACKTPVRS